MALIVTNRSQAGVLDIAKDNSIPSVVINKKKLNDREYMEALLSEYNIDFIALAGFLMLIPEFLVETFENRMVNIHPSLLPKYGGKGMFGHHVHQAVKEAGELESGMTSQSKIKSRWRLNLRLCTKSLSY